jgi:putative ABC transport system substrate-binding protein
VAGSVGLEVIPVDLRDAAELERELAAFAQSVNGGLILTASALSAVHRDLIITLAARHKLPAVYQERNYADAGGLISFGPSFLDQYRKLRDTSIVSAKERSRPTCRLRLRPSMSW